MCIRGSSDAERLIFLLEKIEPTTNVGDFLSAINADGPYWERRVRLYHQTFGNQSPDGLSVSDVLGTAIEFSDAGS